MAGRVDVEAARALAAAGWTVQEAAVGLGCRTDTLRRAAKLGGFSFKGSRKTLDLERMRQLAGNGLTTAQVAAEMGFTCNAVCKAARRHGISFTRTLRAGEWSDRELEVLSEVYPREGTQAAANALGRSCYAVAAMASRQGLRRSGASGTAPNEPWGAESNALLFGLWGHPLAEAASKLGRAEEDVARHARAMGVELKG